MRTYLEFEKPIAELEGKIEELRRTTDAGGIDVAEEVARLRDKAQALGVRVADTSGRGWSMLRHDLFLSDSEVTQVVRRAMDRGGA